MTTITENDSPRSLVWVIDSQRSPLAGCRHAIAPWADAVYFPHDGAASNWGTPSEDLPDVIFFSAEIAGGVGGGAFQELRERAEAIPLIAVARLRSLAQAVAFFRAGAADYLSLPLEPEDARDRADAALRRAAEIALRGVTLEVEPVEGETDPGEVSLRFSPSPGAAPALPAIPPPAPAADPVPLLNEMPLMPLLNDDEDVLALLHPPLEASPASSPEEEPVAVDGLAIPSLWEELPCGVMVFDSNGNLVFSNSVALELFGFDSLAELQDALEERRGEFLAYGANRLPLQDNQWPHVLAGKTRTGRSAVVSVMRPDRRRFWLRIDCLPHLHEGQMNRLSMTLVNLTGEIPALVIDDEGAAVSKEKVGKPSKPTKAKRRGKKRSG